MLLEDTLREAFFAPSIIERESRMREVDRARARPFLEEVDRK